MVFTKKWVICGMNLIIVAATEMEIGPLIAHLRTAHPAPATSVLVTGVGSIATTYSLTRHLQTNRYDLVLQAGVGGSFDRSIKLGDVVFVVADQYGDLGAEDHEQYLDIFEMGLLGTDAAPHKDGKLHTPLSAIHEHIELPRVSGITVNTVSGSEPTIKLRSEKYKATVESMEGAAFHYVCLREGIAFAQVRAISNYVMPRDKSQWQMKDAIYNLNNWLVDFIKE
jgi:futalosine hydrolase